MPPEGANIRRIARGFWNPFGICVRPMERCSQAKTTPVPGRPVDCCRSSQGGDYGYQRSYGNAPIHPFVCWNGELPGTLPMMHSVGEAPCGIAPLGNGLVVTSWTDHRIDFYPLTPNGATFKTHCVTLIRGGNHFRPTCIVQCSPTVFYLTDWVFGSYQLHNRGRVWKLEIDPNRADWLGSLELAPPNDDAKKAERLRVGDHPFSEQELFELAKSADPFIARAAIDALATGVDRIPISKAAELDQADRVTLLLAVRKAKPSDEAWARRFLNDDSPEVVFEALRWIADQRLTAFLPDVERRLNAPD